MHWRRKWQPTPVFLPGESQGRGAWWAAVCGAAKSRTRLKRLSSSSTACSRLPRVGRQPASSPSPERAGAGVGSKDVTSREREGGGARPSFPGCRRLCCHLLPACPQLPWAPRSRQRGPRPSSPAPRYKLSLHSRSVPEAILRVHTVRLSPRSGSGLQPFLFPALQRYS